MRDMETKGGSNPLFYYTFPRESRPRGGKSIGVTEEEEEEEDLFVFNDTVEGPMAPAVKPGRITQA
jgi:hypothetical protein